MKNSELENCTFLFKDFNRENKQKQSQKLLNLSIKKANASSQNKTLEINKTFCLLGSWDIESLSLPKQALYYYTACNAPLDIIIIMKERAN